jgi:glycosyltransferase involved in cell wall biosynthesis
MPEPASPRLDVFILSYNRAAYLRETLECFFNQTFRDFRLTVLDNASTDDTAAVVATLQREHDFAFAPAPENIGAFRNFLRIRELARAPWVMAFHDDDLLHPRALELAFAALERHPSATLCAMNYKGVLDPTLAQFDPVPDGADYRLLEDRAHFAAFCCTDNTLAFASCLYRSENFRALDFDDKPFGKLCDRPAMIEALGAGQAIVFNPVLVLYRLHAGQDSVTSGSGPFLDNALALQAYYARHTGTSWKTSSGRCFVINNRAVLKSFYKWCSDREKMSFTAFVRLARRQGAATWFSFVPRPLARLLKKWYRRRDPRFF